MTKSVWILLFWTGNEYEPFHVYSSEEKLDQKISTLKRKDYWVVKLNLDE